MPTPAEKLEPINDVGVVHPIKNHSSNVSEMLIIGDASESVFSAVHGYENPFRLTKYPRILSVYDLKQVQGSEIIDTIVDLSCKFKGVDRTMKEINKEFWSSGFLVAPPNKLDDCWEYYFVSCLHNYFPTMHDVNCETIILYPQFMRGSVGKNNRTTNNNYCEIVAKSDLTEKESHKENPHKDWCLMKIVVPIARIEQDSKIYPTVYLLPSPSKAFGEKTNSDYDMCILSFIGNPSERDVSTLSHYTSDIDLEKLNTFFEMDCKNISFGKYMISDDQKRCHYNASTFPGSSGGAVLSCEEQFSNWITFKENLSLNRNVVGIHVGSEHSYNRCCPVKYWFPSFYEKVFLPMEENFTMEERELIKAEKMLLDNMMNTSGQ